MDQNLYKAHTQIIDSTSLLSEFSQPVDIRTNHSEENFWFLSNEKHENSPEKSFIRNGQIQLINTIREHLTTLTKSDAWNSIKEQLSQTIKNDVTTTIKQFQDVIFQEIDYFKKKKETFQTRISETFVDNRSQTQRLFAVNSSNISIDTNNERMKMQISSFCIRSLISTVFLLIRSAEKHDPSLIDEILVIATELTDQLPVKCLSFYKIEPFWIKSFEPLIAFMNELSTRSNPSLSAQARMILLSMAMAKGSLRDLLPLITFLVVDKSSTYRVIHLLRRWNDDLSEKLQVEPIDSESHLLISLNYLQTIKIYPFDETNSSDDQLVVTGRFLSSIILTYIHLQDQGDDLNPDPIFFEFHPTTFQQIFFIIEQITMNHPMSLTAEDEQILFVCLKLLTIHLKTLGLVMGPDDDPKFERTEFLCKYTNSDQLNHWFDVLMKWATDERYQALPLGRQAFEALICVIELRSSTFNETFYVLRQYITKEEWPALVSQSLIYLKSDMFFIRWLNSFNQCDDAFSHFSGELFDFLLKLYFNLTDLNHRQLAEEILLKFQRQIFSHWLNIVVNIKSVENSSTKLKSSSSILIQYLKIFFDNIQVPMSKQRNLILEIVFHLFFMTREANIYDDRSIELVLMEVLPLFEQYFIDECSNESSDTDQLDKTLLCWLIGWITHFLIIHLSVDENQIQNEKLLNSSLLFGGASRNLLNEHNDELNEFSRSGLAKYSDYQIDDDEESKDTEFLLSIYHKKSPGVRLLAKLKRNFHHKFKLIPNSIETLAETVCAQVFAVYLKHYHRVKLAIEELEHDENEEIHPQLRSLFEYATNGLPAIIKRKGQQGDCETYCQHIQQRTEFLLRLINGNSSIPTVKPNEIKVVQMPKCSLNKNAFLSRQSSRWSKAKNTIKRLRHLFRACSRFKSLMLERKEKLLKRSEFETNINRVIDEFIYEDFNESNTNEQIDLDQIKSCLIRQHQRALIRLLTYRCSLKFIEKLIKSNNEMMYLMIYLPFLRVQDINWSHLNNLHSTNPRIKQAISDTYHSIIKFLLTADRIPVQWTLNLMNFHYDPTDLISLIKFDLASLLYWKFRTSSYYSIGSKYISFQCFRLFTFQLCEKIEFEHQQHGQCQEEFQKHQASLLRRIIFNEIKTCQYLNSTLKDADNGETISSLKDITLGWFFNGVHNEQGTISTRADLELAINQYLTFLLYCFRVYPNSRTHCTNEFYFQTIVDTYQSAQSSITRLLALKVLRCFVGCLSNQLDENSLSILSMFLNQIRGSIGQLIRTTSDKVHCPTELIHFYRSVLSVKSNLQTNEVESLVEIIKNHLNAQCLLSNDESSINQVTTALFILGSYVEPLHLGALVKVQDEDTQAANVKLGLIIDINRVSDDLSELYTIQFLETNLFKTISFNQIQIETETLSSTLIFSSRQIDQLFETLCWFLKYEINTSDRCMILSYQRQALAVIQTMIKERNSINMLRNNRHASILAKISILDEPYVKCDLSKSMNELDREYLEQYLISLDRDKQESNRIHRITDESNLMKSQVKPNQLTINTQYQLKYPTWKPYMSKIELARFNRGLIFDGNLKLTSMSGNVVDRSMFQECGDKHKFLGRVVPLRSTSTVTFPTIILDKLRVTEGKWYFCIRLLTGGLVQIGWATDGFSPDSMEGEGIGDDQYSWSYDGSRMALFHCPGVTTPFGNNIWEPNDVCGCGIDIAGEKSNIKYWLNGKFLGTAFRHGCEFGDSSRECNMFPDGPQTSFYPGVTLQRGTGSSSKACEFIFHPDDMFQCPLPYGYKPFFAPKLVPVERSIVRYPWRAHLIEECTDHYLARKQLNTNNTLLRDFINNNHLETSFSLDQGYLMLPSDSDGLSFTMDIENLSAFTFSYDLKRSSTERFDCILCTIELNDVLSVPLTFDRCETEYRVVVVVHLEQKTIQIYTDHSNHALSMTFNYDAVSQCQLNILPKMEVGLKNLAIWKHAFDDQDLHCLFKYGISYIAVDYRTVKEYRQRMNRLSFVVNQVEFSDESILPFEEIFKEAQWKEKQQQTINHEEKYFKQIDDGHCSVVQITDKQSYLVLKKSSDTWSDYCIVMDILITEYPQPNKTSTVISLNARTSIAVNRDGNFVLQNETNTVECSKSVVPLNEYIRLFIAVAENEIRIYLNGNEEIHTKVTSDQLFITEDRIELFHDEYFSNRSSDDDSIRFLLKSIAYINDIVLSPNIIEELSKSTEISLDHLLIPPFEIIGSNLLLMGFKDSWIQSIVKNECLADVPSIYRKLVEQKEKLMENDRKNRNNNYLKAVLALKPTVNQNEILSFLSDDDLYDTKIIGTISQSIFETIFSTSQMNVHVSDAENQEEEEVAQSDDDHWFNRFAEDLGISENLSQWANGKSLVSSIKEAACRLLDLTSKEQEQETFNLERQKTKVKFEPDAARNFSDEDHVQYRTACEYQLRKIYARSIMLKIIDCWLHENSKPFPMESFLEIPEVIQMIKILNRMDTFSDRKKRLISKLLSSVIKYEFEQISNAVSSNAVIEQEMLKTLVPYLYHIQNEIITIGMEYLTYWSTQQTLCEQNSVESEPDHLSFIFECHMLFIDLIRNLSKEKSCSVDAIFNVVFPETIIRLLLNLFMRLKDPNQRLAFLYLLTNLTQISSKTIFKSQEEDFFIRLCNSFSTKGNNFDQLIGTRVVQGVLDLIIALRMKRMELMDANVITKKQMESFDSRMKTLPDLVQNVFLFIDLISMIMDKNKRLVPLHELLDQMMKRDIECSLTSEEDLVQMKHSFCTQSDQELSTLITNNMPDTDAPYTDFLAEISSKPEKLVELYKPYAVLPSIPINVILHRLELLYLLNILISDMLRVVDLTTPIGWSYLIDLIRTAKLYIIHSVKMNYLKKCLSSTESQQLDESVPVFFDTIKYSSSKDHTMFHQAYEQLHTNASTLFRCSRDQLWTAQFVHMHSTDQGGPYRDSITRICSDICSDRLSLFTLCPNGRTNVGSFRDCWIPNVFPPEQPIPVEYQNYYRFVGQLFGLAIRKKHYLNVRFAPLMWKRILKEQITIDDIQAIDEQSFTFINEFERNIQQIKSTENETDAKISFDNLFEDLQFDVVSSNGQTFELISGGTNIPVTIDNFQQYCSEYCRYRLEEFDRQIEYVRQGLFSVIPIESIDLFLYEELEVAVCGKQNIDIDLLQRNTNYDEDLNENLPHIKHFWTVLRDMFSDEQRKLFLVFVWGRSTLPQTDGEFNMSFNISTLADLTTAENEDRLLPRSHTCGFTLDLPKYSTAEIMYERLNYAITSCTSIDGDRFFVRRNQSGSDNDSDSDD